MGVVCTYNPKEKENQMNYKEVTEDQIIESVRDHKLWWMHTPEEMMAGLEKWKNREPEEGDFDGMNKSCMLMDINESQITEEIKVGNLTVGVIGKERTGKGMFDEKDIISTRGRYVIYKDTPDRWVKEKTYGNRDDILKIAQVCADIDKDQCESSTVEFPTGELCIANFFCEDRDNGFDELPKDMKYKEEFSINNSFGRRNTMKWLAENKGIAYGQLGNTSVSVYKVSDDKLVVASGSAYTEDEEGYELEIPVPEGWVHVGDICCDVWRFEAVDKQRFVEHGFDLEAYKEDRDHMDFLETKVTAGTWDMKCYYQYMSDEDMTKKFGYPVYAELERRV
jgi:hypothetical protein